MKYAGMPMGMWVLFSGSFQKQLTAVLGYDAATARAITKKAKPQYRQIIRRLPEFEKADRFKMNIVNCAMLGAFILSMPQRPEVDRLTDYYARSMMTKPMQWFCRKSGKSKFTAKDIAAMKATATLKAADRKGQFEAGYAQGFNTAEVLLYIILPQAYRNIVPTLLSQVITTIKDSSYLANVATIELMARIRQLLSAAGTYNGLGTVNVSDVMVLFGAGFLPPFRGLFCVREAAFSENAAKLQKKLQFSHQKRRFPIDSLVIIGV